MCVASPIAICKLVNKVIYVFGKASKRQVFFQSSLVRFRNHDGHRNRDFYTLFWCLCACVTQIKPPTEVAISGDRIHCGCLQNVRKWPKDFTFSEVTFPRNFRKRFVNTMVTATSSIIQRRRGYGSRCISETFYYLLTTLMFVLKTNIAFCDLNM